VYVQAGMSGRLLGVLATCVAGAGGPCLFVVLHDALDGSNMCAVGA
jgi:hypothetical protein